MYLFLSVLNDFYIVKPNPTLPVLVLSCATSNHLSTISTYIFFNLSFTIQSLGFPLNLTVAASQSPLLILSVLVDLNDKENSLNPWSLFSSLIISLSTVVLKTTYLLTVGWLIFLFLAPLTTSKLPHVTL